MSTWNKDISQSLADAVTSVLTEGNGKKKSQLDPVGKEDSDVDNDGDSDSSDEYLMKRRKAISKSIRNTSKTGKKVALNGKKEKVTINPVMGEEFDQIDELKVSTKIRAAAQRAADAEGERVDSEWDGSGSLKRAAKFQAKSDKMRSMIAKKHGDRAAKGVDNLAKIRSGLKPSHSRVRNSQKPDSLANRPSTSISKSGERKGKITRASAERLKSAIRNRSKQRNEEFQEERAAIREAIEHSFDTVFQYSNAEEEAFRNDWMEEFDSIVSGTEPSAYLDPLQRRVYYIEGLSPQQAADRYLTHIRPNRAFAGGEYKASSRGGDVYASSQHQGQGPSRVHHPTFRGNYKTEY